MFQNHPVLLSLKSSLSKKGRPIEGIVKQCRGMQNFLVTAQGARYLVSPEQNRSVMQGDKVRGNLAETEGRPLFFPMKLKNAALSRFLGKVVYRRTTLFIQPEAPHDLLIPATCASVMLLQSGDWVIAELRGHPLRSGAWHAEITQLIASKDASARLQKIALARVGLSSTAPADPDTWTARDRVERVDLTHLPFVTIDGSSTQDLDDALTITPGEGGALGLSIAIADPTAYVEEGSAIDQEASARGFTYYLPGKNVPMLPRSLSEGRCALQEGKPRVALVCTVPISETGEIALDQMHFSLAMIQSVARLHYAEVSQWLEGLEGIQSARQALWPMLKLLLEMVTRRRAWRSTHYLPMEPAHEYRFIFDAHGEVEEIVRETRRIAHHIVEEAMVVANICMAALFKKRGAEALFTVHPGFDPRESAAIAEVLAQEGVEWEAEQLFSIEGYHRFKRHLQNHPTICCGERLKKYHQGSSWANSPAPHFGMGLPHYATWTSPLRKYGDLLNHRIAKALLSGLPPPHISADVLKALETQRRGAKAAEREVVERLYRDFLKKMLPKKISFTAQLIEVCKTGAKVRLLDNGACCFLLANSIPLQEIVCQPEQGAIMHQDQPIYRLGDRMQVTLDTVKKHHRWPLVKLNHASTC